jgi:hypothetical protein
MNTKSHRQTSTAEGDTLVRVARTIGSALGTIAGKINKGSKPARRRRKSLKTRIARRTRAVSATKARSKRSR